ncbi:hypothetical protein B0H15DRAFT_780793, partial [Mycena belliarum]
MDPANQNVFPEQFHAYYKFTYSKAESKQTSAKLWSIYIDEAQRYDTALVESWKADMEGMLIFSGLFSASLTAFLIESYRTLQEDSGTMTVQLLSGISQQLAAMATNSTMPSTSTTQNESFHPALSSLICNTLWFISLCLSITCALLATLVEQWAREFLHKTEKRPSPIQRARVFSFLYFGVHRFGMHGVVDLIPLLLHVSLMLFLAGLVAFLLPINQLMVVLISVFLGVFLMLYCVLTVLPLVTLDSPYHTPFSGPVWNLAQYIHKRLMSVSHQTTTNLHDKIVSQALQTSESRDRRALQWTLDSLTDDNELIPFLEAIPDAIHGVRGFHLVNDYLFLPLLDTSNQRPLGVCISDLLLSCGNMAETSPMRSRGQLAAIKATWALGMIS